MIRAIVAMDPNGAIGRGGKLPWHYSADLQFFKRTTVGNTVVMGRKTWDSIGRPLPDRVNIVLTRRGLAPEHGAGAATSRDVVEADGVVGALRVHEASGRGELYVIGGAQVYAAFAHRIGEWIVTRVPEPVDDADTFLPASLFETFERSRSEEIGDGLTVEFLRRR